MTTISAPWLQLDPKLGPAIFRSLMPFAYAIVVAEL
jgi:hypothetical protein